MPPKSSFQLPPLVKRPEIHISKFTAANTGTESEPAINFADAPDTGVFLKDTGDLAFTVGGNERVFLSNDALTTYEPLVICESEVVRTAANDAGVLYKKAKDPSLYWYSKDIGEVNLITGAIVRAPTVGRLINIPKDNVEETLPASDTNPFPADKQPLLDAVACPEAHHPKTAKSRIAILKAAAAHAADVVMDKLTISSSDDDSDSSDSSSSSDSDKEAKNKGDVPHRHAKSTPPFDNRYCSRKEFERVLESINKDFLAKVTSDAVAATTEQVKHSVQHIIDNKYQRFEPVNEEEIDIITPNGGVLFRKNNALMWKTKAGVQALSFVDINAALLAPSGSICKPGVSFRASPSSGLYLASKYDMRAAVNGADILQLNSTEIATTVPVQAAAGSSGSPSYAFRSAPSTGINCDDMGNLNLVSRGKTMLTLHRDQPIISLSGGDACTTDSSFFSASSSAASSTSPAVQFQLPQGNMLRPALTFGGKSGMYMDTLGKICIAHNTNIASFDSAEVNMSVPLTATKLNLGKYSIESQDDTFMLSRDGLPQFCVNKDVLHAPAIISTELAFKGLKIYDVVDSTGKKRGVKFGASTFMDNNKLSTTKLELMTKDGCTGMLYKKPEDNGLYWTAGEGENKVDIDLTDITNTFPLTAPNGTKHNPVYSFYEDLTSGFFLDTNNCVAVSTGTVCATKFTSNGVTSNNVQAKNVVLGANTKLYVENGQLMFENGCDCGDDAPPSEKFHLSVQPKNIVDWKLPYGSAAAPTYSWSDCARSSSSGLYFDTRYGMPMMSSNGLSAVGFSAGQVVGIVSDKVDTPSYSFYENSTSGMGMVSSSVGPSMYLQHEGSKIILNSEGVGMDHLILSEGSAARAAITIGTDYSIYSSKQGLTIAAVDTPSTDVSSTDTSTPIIDFTSRNASYHKPISFALDAAAVDAVTANDIASSDGLLYSLPNSNGLFWKINGKVTDLSVGNLVDSHVATNGDAANPGYSFANNKGCGMYCTDNNVALAFGGVAVASFDQNRMRVPALFTQLINSDTIYTSRIAHAPNKENVSNILLTANTTNIKNKTILDTLSFASNASSSTTSSNLITYNGSYIFQSNISSNNGLSEEDVKNSVMISKDTIVCGKLQFPTHDLFNPLQMYVDDNGHLQLKSGLSTTNLSVPIFNKTIVAQHGDANNLSITFDGARDKGIYADDKQNVVVTVCGKNHIFGPFTFETHNVLASSVNIGNFSFGAEMCGASEHNEQGMHSHGPLLIKDIDKVIASFDDERVEFAVPVRTNIIQMGSSAIVANTDTIAFASTQPLATSAMSASILRINQSRITVERPLFIDEYAGNPLNLTEYDGCLYKMGRNLMWQNIDKTVNLTDKLPSFPLLGPAGDKEYPTYAFGETSSTGVFMDDNKHIAFAVGGESGISVSEQAIVVKKDGTFLRTPGTLMLSEPAALKFAIRGVPSTTITGFGVTTNSLSVNNQATVAAVSGALHFIPSCGFDAEQSSNVTSSSRTIVSRTGVELQQHLEAPPAPVANKSVRLANNDGELVVQQHGESYSIVNKSVSKIVDYAYDAENIAFNPLKPPRVVDNVELKVGNTCLVFNCAFAHLNGCYDIVVSNDATSNDAASFKWQLSTSYTHRNVVVGTDIYVRYGLIYQKQVFRVLSLVVNSDKSIQTTLASTTVSNYPLRAPIGTNMYSFLGDDASGFGMTIPGHLDFTINNECAAQLSLKGLSLPNKLMFGDEADNVCIDKKLQSLDDEEAIMNLRVKNNLLQITNKQVLLSSSDDLTTPVLAFQSHASTGLTVDKHDDSTSPSTSLHVIVDSKSVAEFGDLTKVKTVLDIPAGETAHPSLCFNGSQSGLCMKGDNAVSVVVDGVDCVVVHDDHVKISSNLVIPDTNLVVPPKNALTVGVNNNALTVRRSDGSMQSLEQMLVMDFTASEPITSGSAIGVCKDGTVAAVCGSSFGAPTCISSNPVKKLVYKCDKRHPKMIIVYSDGSAWQCVVGSAQDKLQLGPATLIALQQNEEVAKIVNMTANNFMIVTHSPSSFRLFHAVLSTGLFCAVSKVYEMDTPPCGSNCFDIDYDADCERLVIAYAISQSVNYVVVATHDINNVCGGQHQQVLKSMYGEKLAVQLLMGGIVLISNGCATRAGFINAVSLTVTLGPEATDHDILSLCDIIFNAETNTVFAVVNNIANDLYILALNVVGNDVDISGKSKVPFAAKNITLKYDIKYNQMIAFMTDNLGSICAQYFSVDSNTIEYGLRYKSVCRYGGINSMAEYMPALGKFFVLSEGPDQLVTFGVTGLAIDSFIGIAQNTASIGEKVTVVLRGGVDKSQSNLKPGQKVYIDSTSKGITNDNSNNYYIGVALGSGCVLLRGI